MKLRKVLAAVLTGAMVLGTMAVSASADDAKFTAGIAGQFDASVEGNFGEWQDTASFNQELEYNKEVTLKVDFGQAVTFSGNYVGLQTNVPVETDDDDVVINDAKLISLKLDGEAVTINDDSYLTAEGFDGGLRINLTNQWNGDIEVQPIDPAVWAGKAFQVIEVTFQINNGDAAADEEPGDDSTTGSSTTAVIFVAVAALAVVATVSTKKFAER